MTFVTSFLFLASALFSDVRIWQVSDRQVVVDYRVEDAPVDIEVHFFTNGVEVADACCWEDDSDRRRINKPGKYRTVWYADSLLDDERTWDVSASATLVARRKGMTDSVVRTETIELGGNGVFIGGAPVSGFRGIWYGNEPSHDEYAFK